MLTRDEFLTKAGGLILIHRMPGKVTCRELCAHDQEQRDRIAALEAEGVKDQLRWRSIETEPPPNVGLFICIHDNSDRGISYSFETAFDLQYLENAKWWVPLPEPPDGVTR